MKRIIGFLTELSLNNNREWFQEHKEEYRQVQALFNDFTMKLVGAVSEFDPQIAQSNLGIKDCTYRIYKDMRFSKEKVPYKTHFGAYINRGGKKSPYAGYYFHIEAPTIHTPDFTYQTKGLLSRNLLAAGLYCYEPKVLKSLRDEFSVNGDSFLTAIDGAVGFSFDSSTSLRKVPAEFVFAPEKWHGLLKQRDFSLFRDITTEHLSAFDLDTSIDSLVEEVALQFRNCKEYVHLLNKAIDYALEM